MDDGGHQIIMVESIGYIKIIIFQKSPLFSSFETIMLKNFSCQLENCTKEYIDFKNYFRRYSNEKDLNITTVRHSKSTRKAGGIVLICFLILLGQSYMFFIY